MLNDRRSIGNTVAARIRVSRDSLFDQWKKTAPIRHFVLDDVLPEEEVRALARKFPDPAALMLRSSLRERKRVGVEVNRYAPAIGEFLFAFQEPEVVRAVGEITGLAGLEADPTLYASGISVMGRGDYLEPHLDNSHDGDGRRYRALNILYYVSPGWKQENGGNLELWDPSVRRAVILPSLFNRLVVMETHQTNWHSVSRVLADQPRCCLSNYYFSTASPTGREYRQVTTFRGRPEQPLKRLLLGLDGLLRNGARRMLPGLQRKTRHRLPGPVDL
jgi:Rps23 Pro-64 3,4-dihydroxylase Tpa1-like proline 4-hydroxylase